MSWLAAAQWHDDHCIAKFAYKRREMLKLLGLEKPDPKELVRKWQQQMRSETRQIDKQIRGKSMMIGK